MGQDKSLGSNSRGALVRSDKSSLGLFRKTGTSIFFDSPTRFSIRLRAGFVKQELFGFMRVIISIPGCFFSNTLPQPAPFRIHVGSVES